MEDLTLKKGNKFIVWKEKEGNYHLSFEAASKKIGEKMLTMGIGPSSSYLHVKVSACNKISTTSFKQETATSWSFLVGKNWA